MSITLHLWVIPLILTIITLAVTFRRRTPERFGVISFLFDGITELIRVFIGIIIVLVIWLAYFIYFYFTHK